MSDSKKGGMEKRGGYTPTNGGYSPKGENTQRPVGDSVTNGYTPSSKPNVSQLPTPPKGGSGEN